MSSDLPQELNSELPQELNSELPQELNSDLPQQLNSDLPKELQATKLASRSSDPTDAIPVGVYPELPDNSLLTAPHIASDRRLELAADLPVELPADIRRADPVEYWDIAENSQEDEKTTTPRRGSDVSSSIYSADGPTSRKSENKGKSVDRDSAKAASMASMGVDTVVETSKSFGRMVGTTLKAPMNVSLGVARGFRNFPKLYNDESIRPSEKVTGIGSGLKVASKEFGFGLYDGFTGLVTQPYRGAEKDGVTGFVKGVGKGLGGLVAKPFAGKSQMVT